MRYLSRLSLRERILLLIMSFIIFLFLIYQFIFVPLIKKREILINREKVLLSEYNKLRDIAEDYVYYRDYYNIMKKKLLGKRNKSVLTYIEDMATSKNIRDNIDYIRPGEIKVNENIIKSYVEVKLDAVDVEELVRFLDSIEKNRPGILVDYIRVKPFFKDRSKVDCIVKLVDIDVKE